MSTSRSSNRDDAESAMGIARRVIDDCDESLTPASILTSDEILAMARALDMIGNAMSETTRNSTVHDSRKRCGNCNALNWKYYTAPKITGGVFNDTKYSILCNRCHDEWKEGTL